MVERQALEDHVKDKLLIGELIQGIISDKFAIILRT
jgi:hypothetical protein